MSRGEIKGPARSGSEKTGGGWMRDRDHPKSRRKRCAWSFVPPSLCRGGVYQPGRAVGRRAGAVWPGFT